MRAVQMRPRGLLISVLGAVLLLSSVAVLKYSNTNGMDEFRAELGKINLRNVETFDLYTDGTTRKLAAAAETEAPKSSVPTLHKKIDRAGTHQTHQKLNGSMLDDRGVVHTFSSQITTELVFSFSPETEQRFSEKLVDPNHEQKVYANSPAMIWDGEKFVVVMRMWLDKEHTLKTTSNHFSDNYLFTRNYDDKMNPLDSHGRVLGIPVRVLERIGDGPIEPRAFPFYDQIYLSFNAAMYWGKKEVDTTLMWDWEGDKFVMPHITDGNPQLNSKLAMPRDKHWSPFTLNDTSYMVYSFDPLRIIKCNSTSDCKFHQNAAPSDYVFQDNFDCLRGGTPTVHYKQDLYITVTHVTLFKPDWKRVYTINLAVLKANTDREHQIIYLSEPININEDLMSKAPIIRTEWIEDNFFFPVSLLLEDEDNIIIGGHINDHSAHLFRVKGIKNIMDNVINQSASLNPAGSKNGVLHNLAREYVVSRTGYTFKT